MVEAPRDIRPRRTIENALEVTRVWGDTVLDVATQDEGAVFFGTTFPSATRLADAKTWAVSIPSGWNAWHEAGDRWSTIPRNVDGDADEFVLGAGDIVHLEHGELGFTWRLIDRRPFPMISLGDRLEGRFPTALFIAFLVHVLMFGGLFSSPKRTKEELYQPMIAAMKLETFTPPLARRAKLAKQSVPGAGRERHGAEGSPFPSGMPVGFGSRHTTKGIVPIAGGIDRSRAIAEQLGLDKLDRGAGLFGTRGSQRELETALASVVPERRRVGENLSSSTARRTPRGRTNRAEAEPADSLAWQKRKKDFGALDGLVKSNIEPLRVRDGEAITGAIDMEAVHRMVARNLDQIRYCYDQSSVIDPGIRGVVHVQFEIGERGQVVQASVTESNIENEATERCVLAKVKRWTFPKPERARAELTIPFLLNRV